MRQPGTVTETPQVRPSPAVSRQGQRDGSLAGIAHRARAAASAAERDLPVMSSPGHLRDAAGALDRGQPESAKRHLRAAMALYSPASLQAHGITDDQRHAAARQHLAAAHRLYLQAAEAEQGAVIAMLAAGLAAGAALAVAGRWAWDRLRARRAMRSAGRGDAIADAVALVLAELTRNRPGSGAILRHADLRRVSLILACFVAAVLRGDGRYDPVQRLDDMRVMLLAGVPGYDGGNGET